MYDDLKGKRVVITGGASGIGYATSKRFIAEGSKVVILDCHQEALDRTLSELPDLNGVVCYLEFSIPHHSITPCQFQET